METKKNIETFLCLIFCAKNSYLTLSLYLLDGILFPKKYKLLSDILIFVYLISIVQYFNTVPEKEFSYSSVYNLLYMYKNQNMQYFFFQCKQFM